MRSNINLHIHTTHSDGKLTVAEIVPRLKALGVEYFAITDHDSVEGVAEAAALAESDGMRMINGVELSCCFNGEAGFDSTYVAHIVALGFDLNKMRAALERIREEKYKTNEKLFSTLVKNGYKVRREVCFIDGIIKERKTLAKELVDLGYVPSVNAAFNNILNVPDCLEFAKNVPFVRDGIRLIHDCGGLAIAAHPFGLARGGKYDLKRPQVAEYCAKLKEYGADGIEVFYHQYNVEAIGFLDGLAQKHGFIKSISTDFHGFDAARYETDEDYRNFVNRKVPTSLIFDKDDCEIDESIRNTLDKLLSVITPFSVGLKRGGVGIIEDLSRSDFSCFNIRNYGDSLDSIAITCCKSKITFEITDGSFDRSYRLDEANTHKFFSAFGLLGKTEEQIKTVIFEVFEKQKEVAMQKNLMDYLEGDDSPESDKQRAEQIRRSGYLPELGNEHYINIFKVICETHNIDYSYSSWGGGY